MKTKENADGGISEEPSRPPCSQSTHGLAGGSPPRLCEEPGPGLPPGASDARFRATFHPFLTLSLRWDFFGMQLALHENSCNTSTRSRFNAFSSRSGRKTPLPALPRCSGWRPVGSSMFWWLRSWLLVVRLPRLVPASCLSCCRTSWRPARAVQRNWALLPPALLPTVPVHALHTALRASKRYRRITRSFTLFLPNIRKIDTVGWGPVAWWET